MHNNPTTRRTRDWWSRLHRQVGMFELYRITGESASQQDDGGGWES
jgi:hypothetical protein